MPVLLRRWHVERGRMHQEIAKCFGIPRPTVTRWLHYFNIPTLSSHRITNQNLLNTGPRRSPPAKPRAVRPLQPRCDESFFNAWTPESAYVLGYFTADGCMFRNPRGSYYLDFTSTDRELVDLVKRLLQAPQRVNNMQPKGRARKIRYHLQIGSKRLFERLRALGFTERKSLTLRFPTIPSGVLPHFVRGYFDGDGSVIVGRFRRGPNRPGQYLNVCRARFTSGSHAFLWKLRARIRRCSSIRGGSITTRRGGSAHDLQYSDRDTTQLCGFMYHGVPDGLFLRRKYKTFLRGQRLRSSGQETTLSGMLFSMGR